jgi:hypothetical protein
MGGQTPKWGGQPPYLSHGGGFEATPKGRLGVARPPPRATGGGSATP